MALTITFKRKFYASETAMENAGETVGGQAGSVVGGAGGAVVGGLGAGAIGTGIGAAWGVNKVSNSRKNLQGAVDAAEEAQKAYKAKLGVQNAAEAAGSADDVLKSATKDANKAFKASEKATAKATNMGKWANMSKWKGAGKGALIGGGVALAAGALTGGLLGSSAGKSTGQSVGAAAGNVVGGTVDSVNNRIAGNNQQRQYAVSQASKNIWGAVKGFVPKSKRMKAARGVVKADQAVQKTAFEAATNPGGLAKKAVETVGKNPLSVAPGYTASTGVLTAAKKGRLTTPDMVLKNTMIGKPVYAATEYTGRKLGRLAEPIVNSAYQMARVM